MCDRRPKAISFYFLLQFRNHMDHKSQPCMHCGTTNWFLFTTKSTNGLTMSKFFENIFVSTLRDSEWSVNASFAFRFLKTIRISFWQRTTSNIFVSKLTLPYEISIQFVWRSVQCQFRGAPLQKRHKRRCKIFTIELNGIRVTAVSAISHCVNYTKLTPTLVRTAIKFMS